MSQFLTSIKAKFSTLSPNQRRMVMLGGAFAIIIVLSTVILTLSQQVTGDGKKPARQKSREIEFHPLTGKDTQKLQNDVLNDRVRQLEGELAKLKNGEIVPGQSKATLADNPLMPKITPAAATAPGKGSGSVPGDGSSVTLGQVVGADPNDPDVLPGQLFAPGIVPPPVRTKRAQNDTSTNVITPKVGASADASDGGFLPPNAKKAKKPKTAQPKGQDNGTPSAEFDGLEDGANPSTGGRKLQVREISDDGDKKNTQNDGKPQAFNNAGEQGIYLPSGSIISGVLITGMDAPTANQAKRDPFPALLRVKEETILPNRYRMDIRECFLVASGYGDLSSERAYLRAETLSCVRNDGGVIEVGMNAYSVGEDGKTGVRGRVVSKNGQLIARSLMAGFMSGVSEILKPQKVATTNLVSNASGETPSVFSTINANQALEQGVLGGVNSALTSIANYYLEMAKNMFPVIEIDAGRKVDFVAIRGARLSVQSGTKAIAGARNNRNGAGGATAGPGGYKPGNYGAGGNQAPLNNISLPR